MNGTLNHLLCVRYCFQHISECVRDQRCCGTPVFDNWLPFIFVRYAILYLRFIWTANFCPRFPRYVFYICRAVNGVQWRTCLAFGHKTRVEDNRSTATAALLASGHSVAEAERSQRGRRAHLQTQTENQEKIIPHAGITVRLRDEIKCTF